MNKLIQNIATAIAVLGVALTAGSGLAGLLGATNYAQGQYA